MGNDNETLRLCDNLSAPYSGKMSTPSGFPAGMAMRSSNKQRRMGPAPIASFEDLNDDFDPLEDKVVLKPMPGKVNHANNVAVKELMYFSV